MSQYTPGNLEKKTLQGCFYNSFYERSEKHILEKEPEEVEAMREATPEVIPAPVQQAQTGWEKIPQELYLLLALMCLCIVTTAVIALHKE